MKLDNEILVATCVLFFGFFFYFFSQKNYVLSIIMLFAFSNYVAILSQIGKKTEANGVINYTPRYIDWALTTPLLLFTLLQRTKIPLPPEKIFFILFLDVVMIYLGYLGILANSVPDQIAFFILSSLLFLFIFFMVYQTHPSPLLFWFLFIGWSLYPIFWILHQRKILSNNLYSEMTAFLDIISKIGYGLLFQL